MLCENKLCFVLFALQEVRYTQIILNDCYFNQPVSGGGLIKVATTLKFYSYCIDVGSRVFGYILTTISNTSLGLRILFITLCCTEHFFQTQEFLTLLQGFLCFICASIGANNSFTLISYLSNFIKVSIYDAKLIF